MSTIIICDLQNHARDLQHEVNGMQSGFLVPLLGPGIEKCIRYQSSKGIKAFNLFISRFFYVLWVLFQISTLNK